MNIDLFLSQNFETEVLEFKEAKNNCDGHNFKNIRFPFEIILANKMSNSAGLQLADLVARPIGLSVLKPEQTNRAFEVLKDKFHKSDSGRVEGVGLKVYP